MLMHMLLITVTAIIMPLVCSDRLNCVISAASLAKLPRCLQNHIRINLTNSLTILASAAVRAGQVYATSLYLLDCNDHIQNPGNCSLARNLFN